MSIEIQWPAMQTNALNHSLQELDAWVVRLPEPILNQVPASGGWTAAQVVMHLLHSYAWILKIVHEPGTPAQREPDARIAELAEIILSSENRFQAPEQLQPEHKHYDKTMLQRMLQNATVQLREVQETLVFDEVCPHPLLAFAGFHTRRHLRQIARTVPEQYRV